MSYSNNWKLANGATVTIGATTYEDAISIGLPSNKAELIELTTLGSTRKEFVTGVQDSDGISVTLPFGATIPAIGSTTVSISLPTLSKTVSFTGIVEGYAGGGLENGKPVELTVSIKPTTAPAIS
jgi:hypothetical protein